MNIPALQILIRQTELDLPERGWIRVETMDEGQSGESQYRQNTFGIESDGVLGGYMNRNEPSPSVIH
jgi:hypothetical protein